MGHAAIGISGAENISTTFPKAIPKLLLCSPPELRLKSFSGGVYVRATAKNIPGNWETLQINFFYLWLKRLNPVIHNSRQNNHT